jgi:hypothetical protein
MLPLFAQHIRGLVVAETLRSSAAAGGRSPRGRFPTRLGFSLLVRLVIESPATR